MTPCTEPPSLAGLRIAIVGKLAGMSKREAQQLIRNQGGAVVDSVDASVQLAVVGEDELPLTDPNELFAADARQAIEQGSLAVINETQLWQRLGLVEAEHPAHRLYTPGMLAELLGVSVAVVRRWHRRGLILPAREVRRLPYFDFREVATARRLAELLVAGMSPQAVEKKLAALARLVPGVERPLAQLSVIVEGKELLLRQGDGLIEPGGQLRFDFKLPAESDAAPVEPSEVDPLNVSRHLLSSTSWPAAEPASASIEEMLNLAAECEEQGDLPAAADLYRTALAAGGPSAEICFTLAELLYRMGDLSAARERYYMAIEIDENYVEARANLGCVLTETGQPDLAVAAFEGALKYHPEYPDANYHLARTLDDLGRDEEADQHWRAFLALAPDSPWAEAARQRLGTLDS